MTGRTAATDASDDVYLRRTILAVVLTAAGSLGIGIGLYSSIFGRHLSRDQLDWSQFGDFLGGTLGPILSFLTLLALALTLVLQNRQLNISATELRLSREELELTRQELHRSAEAQEQAGKALSEQSAISARAARLTTINLLIAHYRTELADIQNKAYPVNDPKVLAIDENRKRLVVLNDLLSRQFERVLKDDEHDPA